MDALPRVSAVRTVRVNFAEKPIVYDFETDWSHADYKSARRGQWMLYAVDRYRFERRIQDFDRQYGFIFSDEHRNNIMLRNVHV